jgi:DNA-binding GntR family transcriptional regulator
MAYADGRAGRRVFREDVKEFLLDAILKGDLKPGDRIIETRVAQQIGVSQGPVREALRDLELFGFVVSEPFRGTRVRETSKEDLIELYEIRAALEGVAAREAARRIDKDTLQKLDALLDLMRATAALGDRPNYIDADNDFHRTIVQASGNRMLLQMWEGTRLTSTTLVTLTLVVRPLGELAERHVDILKALRIGDSAAAEVAIKSHIEELGDWISASKGDQIAAC